ncbi:gram-negative pili assembly chaperone domain protein [Proteus penneri ATCC 35198]|nr:gram-negative pili assembly chaperone domain protein [Proteus penneri ATCC 35198]
MDEERTGYVSRAPKENYQVYLNKYFDNFNISLNYQYSTYWQDKPQTQYGLYASTKIPLPGLSQQDANLSLSATRTERENGYQDDAINLYLTLPLFSGHSMTWSESYSRNGGHNQYNHNVGYSGYSDNDSYSFTVGYNHGQAMESQANISGYYSRALSQADISANASYVPQQYRSIGASINSGITATAHGVALHRNAHGDTRLMLETPGIGGVPLDNGITKTNGLGLAVLPNINSYRKTTASINLSQLPDNIETLESTTDITLTKGAIGYRRLSVMTGEKLFAILSLSNGKNPPFGASVRNANNRELGLVGEDGVTWLVGLSPKDTLFVYWGGKKQCELTLPETLESSSSMLLLPCTSSAVAVKPTTESPNKSSSVNNKKILIKRLNMVSFSPRLGLWAAILTATTLVSSTAYGAVTLDRTRIIFPGTEKAVNITITNDNPEEAYLAQSWIEDLQGNKLTKGAILATPPLQRVEPKSNSLVRLSTTPEFLKLPQDRESAFYFNLREVPPKSSDGNTLQIALQSRVKLFYRPAGILSESETKWAHKVTLTKMAKGYRLNNTTPFHLTVIGFWQHKKP